MNQVFQSSNYRAAWRKPRTAACLIGALSVVPVAAVGAWAIHFVSGLSLEPSVRMLAVAFLSASLPEEAVRFVSILLLFHLFRPNYSSPREGLMLASFCGFGFSALENALYGNFLGWAIGILKFGIATPIHLSLAAIMAAFFLDSARRDSWYRPLYLMFSVVAPFLLHGIYDFSLLAALASQSGLYARLGPTVVTYLLIMGGGAYAWRQCYKPIYKIDTE